MTTALAVQTRVAFNGHPRKPRITKLGIVGMGQVIQEKVWPALRTDGFPLAGVVVCSLEPSSRLDGLPHLYHPVRAGSLLPLDYLDEHGFLSEDTLWIIATPSEHHVHYVLQLAGLCRVAVEKPIGATNREARLLSPFANHGFEVYPIDHKLFNACALAAVDECRKDPSFLHRVSHVYGIFYETAGLSKGREQEDCIADVQWHLFILMISLLRTTGTPFEVAVDRVMISRYEPDPEGRYADSTVWNASRIEGGVLVGPQEITYDFRQAKGAPENAKFLRLFDRGGVLIKEIDLNETGWQAHARALHALMQPVVDMRHTLADTIAVMELIDASRGMACLEPGYTFGDLPSFLK
jgi:predicted dehydrogenase